MTALTRQSVVKSYSAATWVWPNSELGIKTNVPVVAKLAKKKNPKYGKDTVIRQSWSLADK